MLSARQHINSGLRLKCLRRCCNEKRPKMYQSLGRSKLQCIFNALRCRRSGRRRVVVSPLGSDADDCGRTEDEACVYLNTTLLLAGAGDTILVDWRAARLRPDWLCGGSALRLDRPLTLAGHGGRAHIGCPVGGERR